MKQGLVNIEEILVEQRARNFIKDLKFSQEQEDYLDLKYEELNNKRKKDMKSKTLWAMKAYVRKRNFRDEQN